MAHAIDGSSYPLMARDQAVQRDAPEATQSASDPCLRLRTEHLEGRLVSSIVVSLMAGLVLLLFWLVDKDTVHRLFEPPGARWPATSETCVGLVVAWLVLVAAVPWRCVEVLRLLPAPGWVLTHMTWFMLVVALAASSMVISELPSAWRCSEPACAFSADVWPLPWLAVLASVPLVSSALLWPIHRAASRQPQSDVQERDGHSAQASEAHDSAVERPGLVIACSGGGIRSASFCLGALQRIAREPAVYSQAKWLIGVSGGGYLAAAWATLDRHPGTPQADSERVVSPFLLGSPELARLRRNTHYLASSAAVAYEALISLVWGVAITTVFTAAVLSTVAWLGGWQMTLLGTTFDSAARLHLSLPYSLSLWWLGPLAIVSFVLLAPVVADKFRVGRPIDALTRPTTDSWVGAARAGSTAMVLGLLFGALVPGVPLAAAAAHNTAISSASPSLLAEGLYALGFASKDDCDKALQAEWPRAWLQEAQWAELLRTPVTFDFGNCGSDVRATVSPADAASTSAPSLRPTSRRPLTWGGGVSGAVGALSAAFASLVGLLRSTQKAGSRKHVQPTILDRALDVFRRAVAPWLANAIFVLSLYGVLVWVTLSFLRRGPTGGVPHIVLGLLAASAVFWFITSANLTSLLRFYRRRLSFAYLMRRDSRVKVSPLRSAAVPRLSQLQGEGVTGPRLVLCATANVSTRDVVPAGRGGTPFVFAEDGIGFTDEGLPGGSKLLPPDVYESNAGILLNVATAMAISGSAVSALAGRANRVVEPFRLLLAFFNVRTGAWVRNPYWVSNDESGKGWRRWLRVDRLQANPFFVLREAMGSASIRSRYVFLSDGGDFDNLGLVEALRRRPRRIILLDATQEPQDSFIGLGEALSTARVDLFMEADELNLSSMKLGSHTYPRRAWTRFKMHRIKGAGGSQGDDHYECEVVYIKALLLENAPADLHTYKNEHDDFPTTPTVNQLYDEFDFEAYRELGYSVTDDYLRPERR